MIVDVSCGGGEETEDNQTREAKKHTRKYVQSQGVGGVCVVCCVSVWSVVLIMDLSRLLVL